MPLTTVAAAIAGLVLTGIAAPATPSDPGVTGRVIWKRTVGDTDLILREITFPPHESNGWHYHDGTLYVWVRAGTLTHFAKDCRSDGTYHAGQFLTEPAGAANVHIGRNLGDTDLVLDVLYVNPKGRPYAEDAPNPGCDFP